jgi:hypothetical protein
MFSLNMAALKCGLSRTAETKSLTCTARAARSVHQPDPDFCPRHRMIRIVASHGARAGCENDNSDCCSWVHRYLASCFAHRPLAFTVAGQSTEAALIEATVQT